MSKIIYKGKIESDFNGFNDNAVFKMQNGMYWVQTQYRYWYHYAYHPDAIISEEDGHYILTVAGQSIPVRKLYNVIESNIDGEFRGWNGEKTYKLRNGQIWKQAEYKYEYNYAYCPQVMICNINGSYTMFVKGSHIRVKQI